MAVIHRPVIDSKASQFLSLMVIAFATTVVGTRFYLEATGYPQIGNATFHFAHALWGGLLQLIAALLLLIFVNRWVYSLSAILAGVGIGLFVDEVGKFITQRNDYFFPLAAPIIYVVFLLTLLVFLVVRRRSSHDAKSDVYQVLRELEEVLEDDLSESERTALLQRLHRVSRQTTRPDLAELAGHLTVFLNSEIVKIVPERQLAVQRFVNRLSQLENRFISHTLARRVLIAIYLMNAIYTVFSLIILLAVISGNQSALPQVLGEIILTQANVTGEVSLTWYLVMTALHLGTGLLLLFGLGAFVAQRDRQAIVLGTISLVITLTFINTLSFYFHQFSILLNSIYSFVALLALQRYRDRFLRGDQV